MRDLEFTVDSALLSELGEKLVETVHIALVELVKNAYDADATQVTVKISPRESGAPTVEVSDNGTGMRLSDVKKLWMRIATTNKVRKKRSSVYGRPLTGSKGIGRFCCRRLGKHLLLTTTAMREDGRYEKTNVTFEWDKFEPGTEVTSIKCPGINSTSKIGQVGTQLTISGSDTDEWRTRGFNWLKRHFAVLAANRGTKRKGFTEDPGFRILVDAPDFAGEPIDLRDDLINGGWGTLSGRVDRNGNARCVLKAKGVGTKEIVFPQKARELAGVTYTIGIIAERKEQQRKPSLLANWTLREILPEWGGIHIRLNGFRVYPYGDDDWLDIDYDRGRRLGKPHNLLDGFAQKLKGVDPSRALLSLLSFRNHVGDVEIGTEAQGFVLKVNREGFTKSPSIDLLKRFVRFGVDWATVYRDHTIRQSGKEQIAETRNRLQNMLGETISPEQVVGAAVRYIQKEAKNIIRDLPVEERKPITRTMSAATKAILQHEEDSRRELHQLRLIASTSSLVLIFAHEVRQLLGLISANVSTLENVSRQLTGEDRQNVIHLQEEMDETRERFSDLLEMTSLVGVDGQSASPKRLAVKPCISRTIKCYKLIISRRNVEIDIADIPNKTIVGPMIEAELYAIFLNVLSNSIKSVIAKGRNRKIKISASRVGGRTHICVTDTGVGLDSQHFEDVFLPFVADPESVLYRGLKKNLDSKDQEFVGGGSGLGLSIVKQIVESRRGEIAFRNPPEGWSSKLEIILP